MRLPKIKLSLTWQLMVLFWVSVLVFGVIDAISGYDRDQAADMLYAFFILWAFREWQKEGEE